MMRFAFCNEGFGGRPWPEVCESLSKAGYEGVEIAPFTLVEGIKKLSASQRIRLHREARDFGLQVVGLHWLLAKTEGLHLGHPDPVVRAHTTDYLRQLTDLCSDLGGEIMVFGSPRQRGPIKDASTDDTWRWAAETIEGALLTLEERRVILCIEPLGPEETDFITTATEGRRLVDQIAHPNFRLMLDVKAMSTENRPIPKIMQEQAEVLAHVHANDANRRGPGFGTTDFRPILAALRKVGYNGWVSVEPFEFAPDAATVAQKSLHYLKQC